MAINLTTNVFATTEEQDEYLCEQVVTLLKQGIEEKGQGSMVVSGGRTPITFFERLSNADLDWSKVVVTLADERWVDANDSASNQNLVETYLKQNKASELTFVPLKTGDKDATDAVSAVESALDAISSPFDVVILGMGEDGHTASFFPCSEINNLKRVMDVNNNHSCGAVTPNSAPHQRMTLTLRKLLDSRRIFLHLVGDKKQVVLHQALSGKDVYEMPIRSVLNQQGTPVEILLA